MFAFHYLSLCPPITCYNIKEVCTILHPHPATHCYCYTNCVPTTTASTCCWVPQYSVQCTQPQDISWVEAGWKLSAFSLEKDPLFINMTMIYSNFLADLFPELLPDVKRLANFLASLAFGFSPTPICFLPLTVSSLPDNISKPS